jgi:hypothetical protein
MEEEEEEEEEDVIMFCLQNNATDCKECKFLGQYYCREAAVCSLLDCNE